MIPDRKNTGCDGFSIVEMLLVMTILSIIMVTGTMVTNSVIRSSQLSTDAVTLADDLARASLESVKTNHPVKIRFYRYSDTLTSPDPLVQAYQMLTLDSETSRYLQLGKIRFLRQGIAVNESLSASTILSLPENTPVTGEGSNIVTDPELPSIAPYTYYEFEFRPDGSTNLPKDKTWGIVLAYPDQSSDGSVPKNYRALGINPFTGAIKRY